jgi:hypothetical protein
MMVSKHISNFLFPSAQFLYCSYVIHLHPRVTNFYNKDETRRLHLYIDNHQWDYRNMPSKSIRTQYESTNCYVFNTVLPFLGVSKKKILKSTVSFVTSVHPHIYQQIAKAKTYTY